MNTLNPLEYDTTENSCLIIGAGPAGLNAAIQLLKKGVNPEQLTLVSNHFQVGEFGTILAKVPGNTTVEAYLKTYLDMLEVMLERGIIHEDDVTDLEQRHLTIFDLEKENPKYACSLEEATEFLSWVTEKLLLKISHYEGSVTDITTDEDGCHATVKALDGTEQVLNRKKIWLAVGSVPRRLDEATQLKIATANANMIEMHPYLVSSKAALRTYLAENTHICTVAVIGSSHTAALDVMHLLEAGIHVELCMNKAFEFAEAALTPDGKPYVRRDNTGLKGNVAVFIKKLQGLIPYTNEEEQVLFTRYRELLTIHATREAQTVELFSRCQAVTAAIGHQAASTLNIDGKPLAAYDYNKKSGQLADAHGHIFANSAGHPLEVRTPDGTTEKDVGVTKFPKAGNPGSVVDTIVRGLAIGHQLLPPGQAAVSLADSRPTQHICGMTS